LPAAFPGTAPRVIGFDGPDAPARVCATKDVRDKSHRTTPLSGGSWPIGQPVRGHTWETCPFRGRQPCAERRRSYGKPAGAASTFQRRGSGDMTSDTPHPVPARRMVVRSRLRPGLQSQLPPDRAPMKPTKPRALLLSLAITALVAGCGGRDADAPAQSTAQPSSDAGALTLDESKLPGVNRFLASDIDPAVDACTDFGGHVNGKWLAANEIPGDRTSWGAFEM